MGVGNFKDSFKDAGQIFTVSMPTGDYSEYRRHTESTRDGCRDHEDPTYNQEFDEEYVLNEAEFHQINFDDNMKLVIECIKNAANDIGVTVDYTRSGNDETMSLDQDFVKVADSNVVEIGWMQWNDDIIIAVAGNEEFGKYMQDDSDISLGTVETGIRIQKLKPKFDEIVRKTTEYIRLTLMESGIECRFRTGAWTSSVYAMPEDVKILKENLKAEIVEGSYYFTKGRDLSEIFINQEDRLDFLKAFEEIHGLNSIMYPFLTPDGNIITINASDKRIYSSYDADDITRSLISEAEFIDGAWPMPYNEKTKEWWRKVNERSMMSGELIIDAYAYYKAFEDEITFTYTGEEGELVVNDFTDLFISDQYPKM